MSDGFDRVVDLFLLGRLPAMNHERHVAVARILKRRPNGRALMHLGLQATAQRAGVPEKYSAEITDRCWDALAEDGPPALSEFADVLVDRPPLMGDNSGAPEDMNSPAIK